MTPRILVVDDEPDVQHLIKRRFRQQIRQGEFDFDFACDGQEALDRIEHNGNFDIVLSDINMPRMDGLTLLGHLREHSEPMKTIIVSAYGDMDNIRTAMNRGAFDFVTKPINFDDLLATIDKSLDELKFLKGLIGRVTLAESIKEQMEQELRIGRKIQSGFLPTTIPQFDGWAIEPYFSSARQVAGDFYDVFSIEGEGRIGFIVADVCDKGVGAALFMTLFRSLLRSTAKMHEYAEIPDSTKSLYRERPDLLLKRCVQFTNRYIARTHGHTSMFATMFFGLLDPATGHVYYVNAGHEEPYLLDKAGIKTTLNNTGPVVGLFEDADYVVSEFLIEPGQTFFAYTDGVTDAVNGSEEPFSQNRLVELLNDYEEGNLTQRVVKSLQFHVGNAPQFDDITMLSIQRN